jgi:hypothetical protein
VKGLGGLFESLVVLSVRVYAQVTFEIKLTRTVSDHDVRHLRCPAGPVRAAEWLR